MSFMIWSLNYISLNLGSRVLGHGTQISGPGPEFQILVNEYAIFQSKQEEVRFLKVLNQQRDLN